MIKYYCDVCKQEMSEKDRGRIKVEKGSVMTDVHVKIEVITGYQGTWNDGHICHDCIRHVIATGRETSKGVIT